MSNGLDRASVGALVARAAILLAHLREREAFHARVLAERLCSSWLAPTMSVEELLGPDEGPLSDVEGARARALVRARHEAMRARAPESLPAAARLIDLLRAEREHGERARERAVTTLRTDAQRDGDCDASERAALLRLAAALTSLLELRILADRLADPERAERLDAERDRWIALGRGLAARASGRSRDGGPPIEASSRLRPLAGRVVLSVARTPAVLGRLATLLEEAGATTVLATSCRAAVSLARWFHVDAALCVLEGQEDPLLALAPAARSAFASRGAPPLLVALIPGGGHASPDLGEQASSSGFDAAIPIDLADPRGLWISVGLAIQARRVRTGRRNVRRRPRTRPAASV